MSDMCRCRSWCVSVCIVVYHVCTCVGSGVWCCTCGLCEWVCRCLCVLMCVCEWARGCKCDCASICVVVVCVCVYHYMGVDVLSDV